MVERRRMAKATLRMASFEPDSLAGELANSVARADLTIAHVVTLAGRLPATTRDLFLAALGQLLQDRLCEVEAAIGANHG